MKKINLFAIFIALLVTTPSFSQLSNQDYVKAGWMTARMYGGNRSGYGPNWLIMTYGRGYDFVKDADGTHSLVGGWHDCGDHVKFGQTQFYAGYMLLLGYSAFPEGYDDFYSTDYSGYESSGNFSFEGNAGTPNGVPDILDEVKYATDYYIKCIPDGSTFYSQVGNGDYDHKNWVTSVTMAGYGNYDGGENDGPRVIKKNPDDASMVSFAGATLALMSRMYRHFDDTYADECLQHAEYAYQYASAHKSNTGGGTITGSFYGADNKWEDNYVCLLAELYWATGDEAYKTEALTYSEDITDHGWVLDYENSDDLAAYALAKLGDSHGESVLNSICNNYKGSVNGNSVMEVGSSWGRLRYTASASFVLALQHAYNNDGSIHSALQGSIDYILGDNSANQSFVVGFGSTSPQNPHHRNVFMNDNSNYNIPTKNQQHGYLVGGTFDPHSFPDDIGDYQTSEGGIDYNAGLVGALGYINSILSPVDQSKFGFQDCDSPDLGDNKSLCGVGTITLDSQLPTTNRTFSWDKDGESLSETESSLSVSSGGTYTVTADSLGCVTSDIIVISDEIPDINLGEDQVITETITLNTQVSGDALTYIWTKNGSTLSEDTQSINVSDPGTYGVTVSGTGCISKSDEIILSAPPALVQTTSEITIDGTKDDVYPIGTNLESFLVGTPSAANLSAEWSGMWDNSNVYLFISVTDDELYNDSGTAWYEDDGVEVFIDGDNSKGTTYDNNDFQWGFIWGGNLYAGGNNPDNSTTDIVYEIIETPNGYDLEISIPWSTIGVTPVVGNFIGFDLGINDDDDGDGRENKLAWYMSSDDGWQDPSVLGELELVEATETLSNQTISLTSGWNLVSFNVLPEDNAISTIFASADISIIKNSDGFWMPTQVEQLNSLQNITIGEAYLVYANTNTSVTVEGTTNETLSKTLQEGWNLVGVPTTSSRTISTQITDTHIQTVKSFDGFFEVSGSTNSISEFIPNKGYYIYANGTTTINW
ncbi:MAG: glycoside hydrolase family 9 protein [Bacteroidota bacterium]